MANSDQLGIEPYKFEPILSPDETEGRRSFSASQTEHVSSLDEWCSCGSCQQMPSIVDNVCCHGSDLVIPNLEDRESILSHPDFDLLVRNPEVLSLSFIQMMMFKRQQGRAPGHLSNR